LSEVAGYATETWKRCADDTGEGSHEHGPKDGDADEDDRGAEPDEGGCGIGESGGERGDSGC
jgi:hypothetical protein